MKIPQGKNRAFIEAGETPKSKAERPQGGAERREGGRQWMGLSKSSVLGIVCACPLNYKCLLAFSLSPPLLLSPHPLTHSFSHSYLPPYFVFPSFFLFQLNEKECVTGPGHQINPTTHTLSRKQKQGWIKQRDEAVGIFTLIRKSNRRLTDEADIFRYRVKYYIESTGQFPSHKPVGICVLLCEQTNRICDKAFEMQFLLFGSQFTAQLYNKDNSPLLCT